MTPSVLFLALSWLVVCAMGGLAWHWHLQAAEGRGAVKRLKSRLARYEEELSGRDEDHDRLYALIREAEGDAARLRDELEEASRKNMEFVESLPDPDVVEERGMKPETCRLLYENLYPFSPRRWEVRPSDGGFGVAVRLGNSDIYFVAKLFQVPSDGVGREAARSQAEELCDKLNDKAPAPSVKPGLTGTKNRKKKEK